MFEFIKKFFAENKEVVKPSPESRVSVDIPSVRIGNLTWMAHSIKRDLTGFYGQLYKGNLFKISEVNDFIPEGWRLPSVQDYEDLERSCDAFHKNSYYRNSDFEPTKILQRNMGLVIDKDDNAVMAEATYWTSSFARDDLPEICVMEPFEDYGISTTIVGDDCLAQIRCVKD